MLSTEIVGLAPLNKEYKAKIALTDIYVSAMGIFYAVYLSMVIHYYQSVLYFFSEHQNTLVATIKRFKSLLLTNRRRKGRITWSMPNHQMQQFQDLPLKLQWVCPQGSWLPLNIA